MTDDSKALAQLISAMRSFDTSAMNGLICLAARLRGAGLLDDLHVRDLHEHITRPFAAPDVADNPFISPMQTYVDDMFALMLEQIGKGGLPNSAEESGNSPR